MEALQLKHYECFVSSYLASAFELNYIVLTFPEVPNHPDQKYKLTEKGLELRCKFIPELQNDVKITPQVIPQVGAEITL